MKQNKKKNKYIQLIIKSTKYFIEALFGYILYMLFKLVPIVWASNSGYFLGKRFIPLFISKRKHVVLENIQKAFPKKTTKEVEDIFIESCGVFLATIFEIPKGKALIKRVNLIDENNILKYMEDNKCLVFSAHIGNWELFASKFLNLPNKGFAIYKKPNNYFLEKLIFNLRNVPNVIELISLNRETIIYLNNKIKYENVFINMLVDQKIREGIKVDFFGRPAFTSTFLPLLAFKYNIPLIPVHIVRKKNCQFDLILEKPIDIKRTRNKKDDIKNLALLMNKKIEEWIKENPSQWLWLHKRW